MIRIIVGAFIGIALFTVLLLLLENPSTLVKVAYGWCVFSLVIFAAGMVTWASGSKIKYVLSAAYPLVLSSYVITSLIIAFVFGLLSYDGIWTISWGWFCLIELLVLALATWKIQSMGAAEEAIMATENSVKVSTVSWKMLTADMIAIAERVGAADKNAVSRIAEAIRYADPVDHPAVDAVVEKITVKIAELGAAVDAGESEKIAEICTTLDLLVRERANKLLIVK